MNDEEIENFVQEINDLMLTHNIRGLDRKEKIILKMSLVDIDYNDIAIAICNDKHIDWYSVSSIKLDGNNLWKRINDAVVPEGERWGLNIERIKKKRAPGLPTILNKIKAASTLPDYVINSSSIFEENQIPDEENQIPGRSEFTDVMATLGIIGGTRGIEEKYSPIDCIKQVKKTLGFLGILGSKWVDNDVIDEMRGFLSRVNHSRGKVEFLLISPLCDDFKNLYKDGKISGRTESLRHFKELMTEFDCLDVRLYSQLPCFRLIFIDSSIVAVSKYRIDRGNDKEDRSGWTVPHLVIQSESRHSMYYSFEGYFDDIWGRSAPLMGVNIPQGEINIDE